MGDKFGFAFNEASEVWKPVAIVEYAHLYEISNYGRVRRINGKICSPWARNQHGHLAVGLWSKNKPKTIYVHKLVALTFLGEQPSIKHEIRHLDGDHRNNHVSNLSWGTSSENTQDCRLHGRMPIGDKHKNTKILDEDLPKIFEFRRQGFTQEKIASIFGVHRTHIGDILNGSKRPYAQSFI